MKKTITVEEAERNAIMDIGLYTEEFEQYLNEHGIALHEWDYEILGDFYRSLGYEITV